MKNKSALFLLFSFFICSCGQSAKEKTDSVEPPKSDSLKRIDSIQNVLHTDSLKLKAFKDSIYKKGWWNDTTTDKMRGSSVYFANLYSNNEEHLDNRDAHAELTVLHNGKKIRVLFGVIGAVLDLKYSGVNIAVKFDDLPLQNFRGLEPNGGDLETLFISPENKFLDGLTKAKRVIIEAPIYREGRHQFEFDVTGFVMP